MTEAHPLLRFSFHSRLSVLSWSTALLVNGWWVPNSLVGEHIVRGGAPAAGLLSVASAIVVLGWLDVLINDALPAQWHLTWARRRRHLGYAALAATFGMQLYAAAGAPIAGVWGLLLTLFIAAFLCGLYAWTAALRPDHAL